MGLLQREVAKQIGVEKTTIHNWETHRSTPQVRHLPRITNFLGYVPFKTESRSLAGKLRMRRKILGLTQKAMASRIGVDPSSVGFWEREKRKLTKKSIKAVETFLESHPHNP